MRDHTGLILKRLAILFIGVCLACPVSADSYTYSYVGPAVGPDAMTSTFGTMVAELNAEAYGFSFGGYADAFRNLNVISQVYRADQQIDLGPGSDGNSIVLNSGDHTFAYTLDYTPLLGGLVNSAVNDFQLYRVVDDQYFNHVSNPGPAMALDLILGGGYNTDAAFGGGSGTPQLDPSTGMTGENFDMAGFETGEVEFDWPNDGLVDPNTRAMVLVFVSGDIDIWQIGWGSQAGSGLENPDDRIAVGDTGEGANVIGGGSHVNGIPVLIPVIPEPGSLLLTLMTTGVCVLRRKRSKTASS